MRPFVPRASPLVGVDLSLLADEVGETASHTPDGGQGVLDLRRVFFRGEKPFEFDHGGIGFNS